MRRPERSAGPGLMLLDAGNSRLKWALSRQPYRRHRPFTARGVIELARLRRSGGALQRVLRAAGSDIRVWACNVAGAQMQRRISAAAKNAGLAAPQFVRSAAAGGGVHNGYAEAWRLGADRWVALIGARHEYPDQALCIVGIGSAMTIDLLGADGQHHGGSIVPGPHMMIESLLQHTAGIRTRAALRTARDLAQALTTAPDAQARQQGLFARSTRSALLAGARYACAILIERVMQEGRRQLSRRPRLILTGGAADSVTPLLRIAYRREDDLVLRGLAVLAQGAKELSGRCSAVPALEPSPARRR